MCQPRQANLHQLEPQHHVSNRTRGTSDKLFACCLIECDLIYEGCDEFVACVIGTCKNPQLTVGVTGRLYVRELELMNDHELSFFKEAESNATDTQALLIYTRALGLLLKIYLLRSFSS